MFTGLIEAVGSIKSVETTAVGRKLVLPLGRLAQDTSLGDSICVNGVCLTVSALKRDTAEFDVMQETLRASGLESLAVGDRVNLERAMKADGRFGGHMVQGHVDGIGKVIEIKRDPGAWMLWVQTEPELMRLMISKGSVAIDGVSLTIVKADKQRFCVSLIPVTLEETNLSDRRVGDQVNLEADIISKWINRRLDGILTGESHDPLTLEKLIQQGFV